MSEHASIMNWIRTCDEVKVELQMQDYLQSVIKIYAYDKGEMVYIKKADWTEITGWREVHRGTLKEMEEELERLFSFPYEVSDVFTGEHEEKEDADGTNN